MESISGSLAAVKHLHLIVDLPLSIDAAQARMPALRALLARARAGGEPVDEAEAACRALGIERQQDWPLAPLLAAAEGLDTRDGYWLCAEPVAHDIGMNGLLLRSPSPALSLAEARQLAESLTPELAPLQAQLHVPDASHWFLRLPAPPGLITRPLAVALNQSVPPDWLRGTDAAAWLRLCNGLQMVLHQHPLNQAREDDDHLPVNGLWLWAGGVTAPAGTTPAAIHGEGRLARALARAVGLDLQAPPTRLRDLAAGSALVVLNGMSPEQLERNWFAALPSALRWGRWQGLSLNLLGGEGCRIELRRRDFWPW